MRSDAEVDEKTIMLSIADQEQNPRLGIERHIGRRCQALANDLANKKAIYLDIRFWIGIREAFDGTSTDSNAKQLAHYLRQGVERGKLFCPVSLTVFEELCCIGGDSKRTATTEIIQELSAGVTLMPEPDRVEAEIESLAYTIFFPAMKQLPPRVWTRLSYIFGNIYPANIGFADETEIAIQKAFFDHMWEVPLTKALELVNPESFNQKSNNAEIASRINQLNLTHGHKLKSFGQALLDEAAGAADCGEPILKRIFRRFETAKMDEVGPDEDNLSDHRKNLLRHILLGEHAMKLPTLHAHVTIHALLRWEWRSTKLVANDIADFEHAAAALAYGDAFFTEEKLANLVGHRRNNLASLHNCFVTSDVKKALECVKAIVLA